jgi:beta-glucuronidase
VKKAVFYSLFCLLFTLFPNTSIGQHQVVQNIYGREKISLNGQWKLILDPMETGLGKRKYRRDFPSDQKDVSNKGELIEYNWDFARDISVPGDWNSQFEDLLWYEGLAWYRNQFDFERKEGFRYLLYFEAVNYKSQIFLNGEKLGIHEGGFTPFQFDITNALKSTNSLVLAVDNSRLSDGIPAADFDWWNYGGVTRPVWIVVVPETYISDYKFEYDGRNINVNVKLSGQSSNEKQVQIDIPELGISTSMMTNQHGYAEYSIEPKTVETWSPENPKLYQVKINAAEDAVLDMIGFRTIKTDGTDIRLNGESVFLRGICIHEEAIGVGTRTLSLDAARELLLQAKGLNANFVRLAHYPHSEAMTRLADSLGIMVWSEIPVYWEDIDYQNPKTLALAEDMLLANYERDKNRSSIIIWSVANETPITDHRNAFLKHLISTVKMHDPNRLVTAALKVSHEGGIKIIDDPLGEYLDVLSINQYVGWYGTDSPAEITKVTWESNYSKPMLLSEFGAGALSGNHGNKYERWTEEYQEFFIDETMKMATNVPFLRGTSPWVLKDFRSPRRYHGEFQNYWNRKGFIDENGIPKKAYTTLKNWYQHIEEKGQ